MELRIYQPFLTEEHKKHISSVATPWDASHNTGSDSREYELFKNIYDLNKQGANLAWGLVSWKFQLKSTVSLDNFFDFAQDCLSNGADCIFINPMIANEALYASVWEQGGSEGHVGMDIIIRHLSQSIPNIYELMSRDVFAFCNYFVGTKNFWDKYFSFSEEILQNLENEKKNKTAPGNAYAGAANYVKDRSTTMRPFVIERIFSTFLMSNHGLKIASFRHDANHFRYKFGEQLGAILYELSQAKDKALSGNRKDLQISWDKKRKKILSSFAKLIALHADDAPEIYLEISHETQRIL